MNQEASGMAQQSELVLSIIFSVCDVEISACPGWWLKKWGWVGRKKEPSAVPKMGENMQVQLWQAKPLLDKVNNYDVTKIHLSGHQEQECIRLTFDSALELGFSDHRSRSISGT